MKKALLSLLPSFIITLSGCSSTSSMIPASGALYSEPSVVVTQNSSVSASTLGGAAILSVTGHPVSALGLPGEIFSNANTALLFIIYDPLAPNWSIDERPLKSDTYYLSMRAKSFRTGGDGESLQIVKRRASQLLREKGYDSYRILDYSEGVESSTPFTHRVSEATIQLLKQAPTVLR